MDEAPRVRIDHVMLPVADLERSIAFYTSALAMQVVARRVDETRRLEIVHVGWDARGGAPTVELTQRLGGGSVEPLPQMHVAFSTRDLAGLAQIWRRDVPPLQNAADKALVDKEIRVWIEDPDGHVIEVFQFPQVAAEAH
jgi:catechol 2,3-dioxygenase-like lactoylglutathione lyase family enzyme